MAKQLRGAEIEERFWSKVDWDIHNEERCWMWTSPPHFSGYGQFGFKTTEGKTQIAYAHRLAYELEEGPIPGGFEVDHLCHDPKKCSGGRTCPHRLCCNPNHMKLVTGEENSAPHRRANKNAVKTHCKWGHEYTPENTYIGSHGDRNCKTCGALRSISYRTHH